MKSAFYPIPVDGEIKSLIRETARKTRLSQAAAIRSALLIGLPELQKRLPEPRPRMSRQEAVDALFELGSLIRGKRNRELVKPYKLP